MADPRVVTGSVMNMASVLYDSTNKLHAVLMSIRNAPKSLTDIKYDIQGLQQVLQTLQRWSAAMVEGPYLQMTDAQKLCLQALEPPLECCAKTCMEFQAKLAKATSRAGDVKLLQDKEISAFRLRLDCYKETASIAVSFVSTTVPLHGTRATQELVVKTTTLMTGLTGQMHGLEVALQTVLDAGVKKKEALDALEEQHAALGQCLKVCVAAVSGIPASYGNTFGESRALDDAKQLLGTLGDVQPGGPPNTFHLLVAQDRAIQGAGTLSTEVSLAILSLGPGASHTSQALMSLSRGPPTPTSRRADDSPGVYNSQLRPLPPLMTPRYAQRAIGDERMVFPMSNS